MTTSQCKFRIEVIDSCDCPNDCHHPSKSEHASEISYLVSPQINIDPENLPIFAIVLGCFCILPNPNSCQGRHVRWGDGILPHPQVTQEKPVGPAILVSGHDACCSKNCWVYPRPRINGWIMAQFLDVIDRSYTIMPIILKDNTCC